MLKNFMPCLPKTTRRHPLLEVAEMGDIAIGVSIRNDIAQLQPFTQPVRHQVQYVHQIHVTHLVNLARCIIKDWHEQQQQQKGG